jgi:hypothetical protein
VWDSCARPTPQGRGSIDIPLRVISPATMGPIFYKRGTHTQLLTGDNSK